MTSDIKVTTSGDSTDEIRIKDAHISQFVRDLIANLKEKQQKVIQKRFGLSGRKKTTLDAIGKEFGVTRERIRQIEVASLNKLKKLAVLDHNRPTLEKIVKVIEMNGGVIHEEKLVEKLVLDYSKDREEELKKVLKFVLVLSDEVLTLEDSDHTHPGWALAKYKKEIIETVSKTYADILGKKSDVLTDEDLIEESLAHESVKKYQSEISKEFLRSALDISKSLHQAEEGKRGLVSWPWVKPRTIKDKIYFILSKKGEPMHFTEIATEIEKASFDSKKATLQTIHNELISDNRFILVGRGLYGLNSWGFESGTVEEVIEKVIIKHAPISQNDILTEVMKKKKVKKATVLINLQNSPKFKKTAEGYVLAA